MLFYCCVFLDITNVTFSSVSSNLNGGAMHIETTSFRSVNIKDTIFERCLFREIFERTD
jgi:hypothetical protein